jgi:hypothetical protein
MTIYIIISISTKYIKDILQGNPFLHMHNLENILSLPSLLHSSEKKKIGFNENGVYDGSVKHLG